MRKLSNPAAAIIACFPSFLIKVKKVGASVFNLDYSYVTRNAGILCGIGIPAELFFFWFESSRGYWDSLAIRLVVISAFVSIAIVDWKKPRGYLAIVHWEAVLSIVFPNPIHMVDAAQPCE